MRSPPLLPLLLLLCRCTAEPRCPAGRADDAPTKALLAPLVFQGRLAALAERGVAVHATFALQRPMKGAVAGGVVVVQFGGRRCGTAPFPRGLLLLHGRYIVFAGRRGRRLVATAAPEPLSRRKEIARMLCDGCARAPSVRGPSGAHPEPQSRLRLRCRASGNPPPKVVWFKDGLRIKSDGRLKVRSKRRHSQLVIARVSAADGGQYECRASNVLGNASSSATVIVAPPSTTESTLWPFKILPCPMAHYCLNGGLCSLYETVGEYVCECAEGFRGRRCESKAISTLNSPPTVSASKAVHDLIATTRLLQHYWGRRR